MIYFLTIVGVGLATIIYGLYVILINSVNFQTSRTGGDIVAKVLECYGIKQLFTLTGGHIAPILVSSEKLGIKVIDVRHEATAAFAADAVSRLSSDNQVGIAVVTAGPGVTNCITALRNAQLAESGFVLIGGASPLLLKGRGSLQDVEQLGLLKGVCKNVLGCSRVKDIANVVSKAIVLSQAGVPGPVFVELPIDILYSVGEVVKNTKVDRPTKSIVSVLINQYIKLRICYHFSHNSQTISYKEIKDKHVKQYNKSLRTHLKKSRYAEIFNHLSIARKPVVLVGSQVLNAPRAYCLAELIEYLKKLRMPIFFSGSTRGLMGEEHWKYEFRHKKRNALKAADFVLLLGVACDFRLDYGRHLNKEAKIISVNENPRSLKLNKRVFWDGLTFNMKPLVFLAEIFDTSYVDKSIPDVLKKNEIRNNDWMLELQKREMGRNNQISELSKLETAEERINPIKLCKYINDNLIDNKTILILDGGDFVGTAAYTMRPRGPMKWLDPGPFGTLGVGGGFALGAKLCYPDHQVIIIWGDGASGYSILEYDTFKRHNLPVLGIIGNDACWSQIKRDQVKILESEVACNLDYSKYERIGGCFGANGLSICNIGELEECVDNYVKNIKNEESYIINAHISKSNFRDGSISV